MPHALAQAASQAAEQARRAALARETRGTVKAMLAGRQQRPAESLPARTWAAMNLRVRTVLVMLGGTSSQDPGTVAAMPWEALPASDQTSIAAVAREMREQLQGAICLW